MALVNPNSPSFALRGRYGNLVYRHRRGRTYVSYRPNPQEGPRSPKQVDQQNRFADAMRRVREMMAQPETKARYKKIGDREDRPAFTLALADLLRKPTIGAFSLETEAEGDSITFSIDEITVEQVDVAVHSNDGVALETGRARRVGKLWWYPLAQRIPDGETRRVTVTARDFPGNVSTRVALVPEG
jgi:hypothetical protein